MEETQKTEKRKERKVCEVIDHDTDSVTIKCPLGQTIPSSPEE